MGSLKRLLRLAPAPVRKKAFPRNPFDGVNGDQVDISIETTVLKSIIEKEQIPEVFIFGNEACRVTIGSDHDRCAEGTFRYQEGFIAGFIPWHHGAFA